MQKTTSLSLSSLRADFPQFAFKAHAVFHWSPSSRTIYFNKDEVTTTGGILQLLHELSHALLNHVTFGSGIELLKMETAAWDKARELAAHYDFTVNEQRIEHCLDSYRDWLHLRSTCPRCKAVATEVKSHHYHCFNCLQQWTVPKDQRSRHYRRKT